MGLDPTRPTPVAHGQNLGYTSPGPVIGDLPPQPATYDDVDYIYRALNDPDRRGFLFVAGANDDIDIPPADWLRYIRKLVSGTHGIASAYVLDTDATNALNARLPDTHHIRGWTMRTYLPNPIFEDPRDSLRHRILTTARIADDSDSRLRDLLTRSACRHSTTTPVPNDLVRIDRRLRELLDDVLITRVDPPRTTIQAPFAAQPAQLDIANPTSSTGSPHPADVTDNEPHLGHNVIAVLRKVVSSVIGTAEVTVDAVTRLGSLATEGLNSQHNLGLIRTRLRTLEDERNALEDQKDEYWRRAQDGQDDLAGIRIDLSEAEKELRHLRSELAKLDRGGTVSWIPRFEATDEPPATFQELVTRIGEFSFIRFTGDPKDALDLDEHGLFDWSIRTWDALRALNDYCRVRSSGAFDGSVDDYISDSPIGCATLTPGAHARGETKATQDHSVYGKARTFPVPTSVDPSGEIFMGAHVRIAKYGNISPRMHYYNDANGSEKIYIGYIGRHLPNFRTT